MLEPKNWFDCLAKSPAAYVEMVRKSASTVRGVKLVSAVRKSLETRCTVARVSFCALRSDHLTPNTMAHNTLMTDTTASTGTSQLGALPPGRTVRGRTRRRRGGCGREMVDDSPTATSSGTSVSAGRRAGPPTTATPLVLETDRSSVISSSLSP